MKPKIQIDELPITESYLPQKRLIQPRGELALIEDGMRFKHLDIIIQRKWSISMSSAGSSWFN